MTGLVQYWHREVPVYTVITTQAEMLCYCVPGACWALMGRIGQIYMVLNSLVSMPKTQGSIILYQGRRDKT